MSPFQTSVGLIKSDKSSERQRETSDHSTNHLELGIIAVVYNWPWNTKVRKDLLNVKQYEL